MKSSKLFHYLFSFLTILILQSCTTKIPIKPKTIKTQTTVPLKAAIIIPSRVKNDSYQRSGLFLVGMVHTWSFDIGKALLKASQDNFSRYFESISIYSREDDITDENIVIKPVIKNYNLSQGIGTTFTLQCVIVDSKGNDVYRKSIHAKDNTFHSSFCLAGCFGYFAAKPAMTNSASSAYEEAFKALFKDMKKRVDFDELIMKESMKGKTIQIVISMS